MAETRLVFAGDRPAWELARAQRDGRLRRLARGVYTDDPATPAADLIRARRWEVVARLVPDALVADRSSAPARRPRGARRQPLRRVLRTVGPPPAAGTRRPSQVGRRPLDDDPRWVAGLRAYFSSAQRYVDTEAAAPSTARGLAALDEIERAVDEDESGEDGSELLAALEANRAAEGRTLA